MCKHLGNVNLVVSILVRFCNAVHRLPASLKLILKSRIMIRDLRVVVLELNAMGRVKMKVYLEILLDAFHNQITFVLFLHCLIL